MGYNGLQRLFWTSAFHGNLSWANKLAWVGGIVSDLISIFCILALFMMAIQIVFTLIYFSNPEFWKNVHDIKDKNIYSGGYALGMGVQTGKNWITGNIRDKSTGMDVLVDIIFIVIPDMIKYSEYNPEYRAEKLNENDTLGRWFILTFPKKILLMFVLSATFSGATFQFYGQVIACMSVVMNKILNQNMASWVQNALDAGSNFQFNIGSSGKPLDVLRQDICEHIYGDIISQTSINSTGQRMTLGKTVQDRISGLSDSQILSYVKSETGQTVAPSNYGAIKFDTVVNTSSQSYGGLTYSFGSFGAQPSTGSQMQYIHIYFELGHVNNIFNYKLTPDGTPGNPNSTSLNDGGI